MAFLVAGFVVWIAVNDRFQLYSDLATKATPAPAYPNKPVPYVGNTGIPKGSPFGDFLEWIYPFDPTRPK